MKFVVQRVRQASVEVQEKQIGAIKKGLLLLVGIKKGDTEKEAAWLIHKVLHMRIFEDKQGKMNNSVTDERGALLIVPNFTLYADATKGNRPGFNEAESPQKAEKLYHKMIEMFKKTTNLKVETGVFGADMQVELVNDGPVTIILEK